MSLRSNSSSSGAAPETPKQSLSGHTSLFLDKFEHLLHLVNNGHNFSNENLYLAERSIIMACSNLSSCKKPWIRIIQSSLNLDSETQIGFRIAGMQTIKQNDLLLIFQWFVGRCIKRQWMIFFR